jgi:hypothetical protein
VRPRPAGGPETEAEEDRTSEVIRKTMPHCALGPLRVTIGTGRPGAVNFRVSAKSFWRANAQASTGYV